MSGFEIIGGIAAVVQLLQIAVDVGDRIKSAKDKKGLRQVIAYNQDEVNSLRDIVDVVSKEKALHTRAVTAEIAEIALLAQNLEDLLRVMEDSSFVARFMHGKDQKADLRFLTEHIARFKSSLTLKIQSAHVGLTVSANNVFLAKLEKIESVETMLKEALSGFRGLAIADVVKGKEPVDGNVTLREEDLDELEIESETLDKDSLDQLGIDSKKFGVLEGLTITVQDNLTLDQALQINGPVGEKGFIRPRHTEILGNVATGQSCQINYAISDEEFKRVMTQQTERTKAVFTKLSGDQIVEVLKAQGEAAYRHRDGVKEGRIQKSEDHRLDGHGET